MDFIKENALSLGLIAVAVVGFVGVAAYHNNWMEERRKTKDETAKPKAELR
ncbi:hypothetical protein [Pseudomonas phage PA1C]|uniref:Uncharacterized protein n=1 Tax=Pseudomonas phage vB_PaeM_PS119XW TaxID=2601632 RepID=A0A5C1K7J2_9CAUD|nr:hypothetical protein PP933_gp121 [Pseudomonas phage vB_PaeM_PS119XW]QBX32276.1 hypothetical protein [Pseudomonas phage PA1C]QEM41850.1 hypothetical protein [Pseudomonas phage vB_PaeM_PS119XW]BEG72756.1 hypothetical protein RVBP21_3840 [Pseudomonas phage BRkr]